MASVTIIVDPGGTDNGVPFPAVGEVLECTEQQASSLIHNGFAERTETAATVETAAETATTSRARRK